MKFPFTTNSTKSCISKSSWSGTIIICSPWTTGDELQAKKYPAFWAGLKYCPVAGLGESVRGKWSAQLFRTRHLSHVQYATVAG